MRLQKFVSVLRDAPVVTSDQPTVRLLQMVTQRQADGVSFIVRDVPACTILLAAVQRGRQVVCDQPFDSFAVMRSRCSFRKANRTASRPSHTRALMQASE